jgi:hypothetical protein
MLQVASEIMLSTKVILFLQNLHNLDHCKAKKPSLKAVMRILSYFRVPEKRLNYRESVLFTIYLLKRVSRIYLLQRNHINVEG